MRSVVDKTMRTEKTTLRIKMCWPRSSSTRSGLYCMNPLEDMIALRTRIVSLREGTHVCVREDWERRGKEKNINGHSVSAKRKCKARESQLGLSFRWRVTTGMVWGKEGTQFGIARSSRSSLSSRDYGKGGIVGMLNTKCRIVTCRHEGKKGKSKVLADTKSFRATPT